MSEAPWSLEAEQAALGAMLLSGQATAQGMALLQAPADFLPEAHQQIFQAIQAVYERHEPVDLITVTNELRRLGHLEGCGGGDYLTAIMGKVPTSLHAQRYASIVAEHACKRQLMSIGQQLATEASGDAEIAELVDLAADRIFALRAFRVAGERSVPVSRAVEKFWDWQYRIMEEDKSVQGARLGIPSIDRQIGGFSDWEIVLFKAEEKFGKTRLLRHSLLSTATAGLPVLVYILEGNLTRWLQGCVAWLANVPAKLLDRGGKQHQSEEQEWQIAEAMSKLPQLPIRIASNLRTVQQVQADILACWYSMPEKPVAIYIDYLQLLTAPEIDSRVEQIKSALEMMLAVNARTGMPIITASQINRGEQTFYSSEAQHAASLVWQIERGPAGAKISSAEARMQDEIRLLNTHKRYGPMLRPVELEANWPSGRFYDRETDHEEHDRW